VPLEGITDGPLSLMVDAPPDQRLASSKSREDLTLSAAEEWAAAIGNPSARRRMLDIGTMQCMQTSHKRSSAVDSLLGMVITEHTALGIEVKAHPTIPLATMLIVTEQAPRPAAAPRLVLAQTAITDRAAKHEHATLGV